MVVRVVALHLIDVFDAGVMRLINVDALRHATFWPVTSKGAAVLSLAFLTGEDLALSGRPAEEVAAVLQSWAVKSRRYTAPVVKVKAVKS